jgi:hypothetical protein
VLGLRKALEKAGIPIYLETAQSGYRIRPSEHIGYLISSKMEFKSQAEMAAFVLREAFRDQPFTKNEAVAQINLSGDQMKRMLRTMVDSDLLLMEGSSRYSRYRNIA